MKRILMIATGGTIASRPSANGLTPQLGAAELLAMVPGIAATRRPSSSAAIHGRAPRPPSERQKYQLSFRTAKDQVNLSITGTVIAADQCISLFQCPVSRIPLSLPSKALSLIVQNQPSAFADIFLSHQQRGNGF